MKQTKKIVGRRDYWTVDIHYGEYQGKKGDIWSKKILMLRMVLNQCLTRLNGSMIL